MQRKFVPGMDSGIIHNSLSADLGLESHHLHQEKKVYEGILSLTVALLGNA